MNRLFRSVALANHRSNDYDYSINTDGEYANAAGHVGVECLSRIYSGTTFRVYRSNDLTSIIEFNRQRNEREHYKQYY